MIVVDASAVGAMVMPDEGGVMADAVRHAFGTTTIHVPTIWPTEIASVIVNGLRRKRLDEQQYAQAKRMADALMPMVVIEPDASTTATVELARTLSLSAYDATYVMVCQRLDAPLLTGDGPLRRAALSLGLALVVS